MSKTANENGMVMRRYLQGVTGKKQESELVVEKSLGFKKNVTMKKICSEVLVQSNVVSRVPKGNHLIDAAGSGRRVLPITVSTRHTMSLEAMGNLCKELETIDQARKTAPERLEFYWVVPIGEAYLWKGKAPYSYRAKNEAAGRTHREKFVARNKLVEFVNNYMDNYVDQYVLPFTFESPITFAHRKVTEALDQGNDILLQKN